MHLPSKHGGNTSRTKLLRLSMDVISSVDDGILVVLLATVLADSVLFSYQRRCSVEVRCELRTSGDHRLPGA